MAVSRASARRTLGQTLRSPRLAVWLLAILIVYMAVSTIVPQRSYRGEELSQWAERYPALAAVTGSLGLHDAYVNIFFLALVVLLAASTAACAWQRTTRATGMLRRLGTIDSGRVGSIRSAPVARIPLTGEDGGDTAYREAASALRSLGLSVRTGPLVTEASSGALGLLGSPVFHWALVGLMLAIPAGQLVRAEGQIGIVTGYEKADVAEEYGVLERGLFHGELSGLVIGVEPEMPLEYIDGGVDRGAAPEVYLRDGESVVARGRVYPNKPLRYGAMTIHMSEHGLGAVVSLVTSETAEESQYLIDRDASSPTGWGKGVQGLYDEAGRELAEISVEPDPESTGRAVVEIDRPGEQTLRSSSLGVGDTVELMDGASLRVEYLGSYARLSVVEDPSVPVVYLLLTIACIAAAVSVLVPYRTVWLVRDEVDGEPVVAVSIRHSRGERSFRERVLEVLAGQEEQ